MIPDSAYVTPRELEIIRLLALGKEPKVIAKELRLSIFSIFTLISRARRRLNSNKYDLVYRAHVMGLLRNQKPIVPIFNYQNPLRDSHGKLCKRK